MNITFIGGGNMAAGIIAGLVREGDHHIRVVEPDAAKGAQLAADYGVTALDSAPAAFGQDEIVVLAVKPQILREVCTQLAGGLNGALVVSIAAGIRADALTRWLSGHTRIVRVMPNMPAMIGKGMSGMFATARVDEADRAAAETVMRAVGETLWLADETGIDDITCISGSGPAYVFYFMESMMEAATAAGFDEAEARRLVLATFDGAVELVSNSLLPVSTLRQNVMSKGGTTERAIARFEAEGVKAAIKAGAEDCRLRSIEMGNELGQD